MLYNFMLDKATDWNIRDFIQLFVLPSIIMMIFTSIYGVVDGFFVSNYAGKTEFAAVNLIMPFPMLLGGFLPVVFSLSLMVYGWL